MTRAFKISLRQLAFGALIGALGAPALAAGYGFTVDVTLSPKAAALLRAKHEAIIVSAMYSGEPVPAKTKQADEMGEIDLGSENVTIAGMTGQAAISGKGVIIAHLGWVKVPQVLINVYSARHSDPNNLLDCGIFEDSIAKAQAAPIKIFCKVIGEP